MLAARLRAVQQEIRRDLLPAASDAVGVRCEGLPAGGARHGGKNGPAPAQRRAAKRNGLRRVLVGLAAMAVSFAAGAYRFNDGTTMHCFAAGEPVMEYDAPPTHPLVAANHAGLVERNGSAYRIAWNAAMLRSLPAEVHDFIFFHECAHASVPTQDELLANCVGLKTMRAVGRAGFAVETRLSAFYGPGSAYWRQTLACANGSDNPATPPVPH
jgi:hypothetical protein